ncbi:MAG: DNA primase [Actinomycetaceae bacterium]|nr:DNA primase [Arcanobacterium sp.]MDD7505363.1 DNA primase [Actinomycetaceae bacterium]MDY6142752.1 DNA primase [Arcanobacterium sp.]
MAGLIKRDSIDEVRSRVRIDDVVGAYVALKPAGMDSLVGLCPFHDEKTPSFNVRPHVGRYHCFGCGESGDVISFIENIEHVSFVEAVELLASRNGITLQYDESARKQSGDKEITRARLIDAHRVAEQFYIAQLSTPEASEGRKMLADRGFSDEAIAHFKVGYSPNSWDELLRELRRRGFTEKEIAASGLVSQGARGVYDRFRGRLMWPIHSITGEPIGFGARRLRDDDNGPKYLNTPETLIYKKSQVLYGLDLAKKSIVRDRRIVIVEGYTDVMAAHLAGVEQAVATCGTAFGHEHAKIARRLIGDSKGVASGVILDAGKAFGGEVIFTFDGDDAGKKAAVRAFQEDQTFGAQTFVSIFREGLDPCDVRLKYGDEELAKEINQFEPLFAFVIRSALDGLPLRTAEGRTAGLRFTAPIVASIRDQVLRGEYVRLLAGWLGMDEHTVREAVIIAVRENAGRQAQARITASRQDHDARGDVEAGDSHVLPDRASITDPVERVERAALDVILQLPRMAMWANAQHLPEQSFTVPVYRAVHDAVRAAGGIQIHDTKMQELMAGGLDEAQAESEALRWYVEQVLAYSDDVVGRAVSQLAVEPLEESRTDNMWHYVRGVMMRLILYGYNRQIAQLRAELRRVGEDAPEAKALFERLVQLQTQREKFSEVDT